MSPTKLLLLTVAVAGLLALPVPARAHCDTLSGPVVGAAKKALDAGDLGPVLRWVKPEAEPELRQAFDRTLAVRSQGSKARELADQYFLETVVRLHRAGEGAPYTGLKAEPDDPAGLIAASDRALEGKSADPLVALVTSGVATGLRERYDRVVEARKHADESVDAGRRFVAAYVEYVHFVEALQLVLAPAGQHAQNAGHDHRQ